MYCVGSAHYTANKGEVVILYAHSSELLFLIKINLNNVLFYVVIINYNHFS